MRLENTSAFRRGIISSHTPVKLGVLVWMYDFFLNQGNMYNSNFEFPYKKFYWNDLRGVSNCSKFTQWNIYLALFCNEYPNFIIWFPFFSTYCNVKAFERKKIVDQSTKFNCSSFAKKSLKNQMRNYYYHCTSVFRRDDLSHSPDCEAPCFW